MQNKSKTVIASVLLAAGLLSTPVLGQFAVVDFAHIAETVANGKTMISQLSQLIQTYNRITQQYNQAVYMAKYLTTLSGYKVTPTSWQGMIASNTAGTTSGWIAAVNSGLNVTGGWLSSTYARPSYSTLASIIPAVQQVRAKMDYGTAELRDGTSQAAIQTIGSLRLHGSQSEASLNALEQDSISATPDQNTTAALLNKINAAGMVNARMAADTNKALVNQAEMQLIVLKAQRDAEAAALENEIAFRTVGMAALQAQHAGISNAMMTYVNP